MKKPVLPFCLICTLLLCLTSSAQDGTNDPSFIPSPATGANNGSIFASSVQSDGKILIGGNFTMYNNTSRNCIARLNTDGTPDASFTAGAGANSTVYAMAVQSDGKILIAGNFTSYNGASINRLARLNSDGSLDASFITGSGPGTSNVYTLSLQPDGKVLIGGDFSTYNGTTRSRLARLNTDGSLDLTFDPGSAFSTIVYTTSIQGDGKIIAAGGGIRRLNTNGSVDATFAVTGTGFSGFIQTAAIQSDGKIVVGGDFDSYNGTTIHKLARLNINGTLDAAFNNGGTSTGSSSLIKAVALQGDGKILVGGYFTSYNNAAVSCFIRLNTDGTLDTGFNSGTGANSYVYTISVLNNGGILIGGIFTSYNGTNRDRIARLKNSITTDIKNIDTHADGLSVFPNPNEGNFTIVFSRETTVTLTDNLGQIIQTLKLNESNNHSADISNLNNGVYFLRDESRGQWNTKIIVAK